MWGITRQPPETEKNQEAAISVLFRHIVVNSNIISFKCEKWLPLMKGTLGIGGKMVMTADY